jgi:hypothetical protein
MAIALDAASFNIIGDRLIFQEFQGDRPVF